VEEKQILRSAQYDNFNRLISANEVNSSGTTIDGLSWDYDRYGNRWHQNLTAGTGTSTSMSFDTGSNHATSNTLYDAAGSVRNDTSHNYLYDAENRTFQVDSGITYIYDAEGRRVGKSDGTVYVVTPSGNVLDELKNGQQVRSEIYAAGHHVATYSGNTVYFIHSDWLGTERARTNAAGVLCEVITSQPFGDSTVKSTPPNAPACDPSPDFYTGKQRDQESNLDDFGARYFSSQWGRWMSPDWSASPSAVPYATLANPQSLNLYAYVGNDPVNGEDPDGHMVFATGTGCGNSDFTCSMDEFDDPAVQADKEAPASDQSSQQNQQAQQQTTPAPTPNPNGSVPAPPPGKGPGWKPGDPLTPNEWVPGQGSTDRPTRWGPKYPIPGQSPPNTSWDAPNGHWDNPDGKGNTTRWLPGGVPVDHDNNPLTRNVVRGAAAGAAAIGTGYIIYRVIRMLPLLAPPLWPTIPANAIIP
jgi:RHS repeat-associated protein